MIDESTVNSQTTDSVTQADTLMLGLSASHSMGIVNMVTAETLGMSMHNAVSAQQNSQMSASASVTASCVKMLQAAPPGPQVPAPAPITPPPFMPLDPVGDEGAADLVKEATEMAEKAISILENEADAGVAEKKGLETLISKLQAFTGATSTNNASKNKTSSTTKKRNVK